jgi:MFS family permease
MAERPARTVAAGGGYDTVHAPRRPSERRVVIGTSLVYGLVFLDRFAPLYLVVLLRRSLDLSDASLALLPAAIGLGWAGAMIVARITSGRLTDRSRILFGVVAGTTLNVASVLLGGWTAFVVCRFLGGLLQGSIAPSITSTVFRYCGATTRGRAIGVVFSGTRLFGSLLSPVIVLAVAVRWGWQLSLVVSAALAFAGLLAFLTFVPSSPLDAVPPRPRSIRRSTRASVAPPLELHPHGRRNIALSTVISTLLVTWLVVISQSGPVVLVESLGVTPDQAGGIVGAFGIGAWLAALAVPTLSQRFGRRHTTAAAIATGGAAGLLLSVLLALPGSAATIVPTTIALAVAGVALGSLPMAISLLPAETVRRGDPGRAIFWPVVGAEVIGAALLPAVALLGLLPERVSIAAASGGLLAAAAAALALRTSTVDQPDEQV